MFGGIKQRVLRQQANHFAFADAHAIASGFRTYHLDHAVNRCGTIIDQIHRNLGATIHQQAQRFDIAQTAAQMPHDIGDAPGDLNIAAVEVHVEGDQRLPCANHGCTGGRGHGGAKIRRTSGINANAFAPGFVFTAPHIGQIAPFRSAGGFLVQIHRNPQLIADASPNFPRQRHTFAHRRIAQRHKRHHVGCANPWMSAALFIQINVLLRDFGGLKRRFAHSIGGASKTDHGAIVVAIRLHIQQLHA